MCKRKTMYSVIKTSGKFVAKDKANRMTYVEVIYGQTKNTSFIRDTRKKKMSPVL